MNAIVSIIVPCYNQAQYLDEALQSVLDQTYQNWECIIVNDGSSDNTEEVAQKWVQKDVRFQYFFKKNGGVSSTRNLGICYAIGEFILPLDADDRIGRTYINSAVRVFRRNSTLKLVYSKAEYFGDKTGLWYLPSFSIQNLARFNMIFCSAIYRKKDWELVGGYDVNMIYGIEDWEFWIAILKDGGNVFRLDTVEFYYRVKKVSRQKQLDGKMTKMMNEYMCIKHVDFFVKQLGSFLELNEVIEANKKCSENLKSEKFVIDVFCTTFFGFSVFGLYKIKKQ
ncbi:glycosyltransferase family 2 protein [Flavobacterium soyangense]|uniref:Glycosyltransferase family 2 protein n=1 Tax=Flavobacterium soyangense TaxID=2023265 RepID=A0A930Y087_9FLAO|nr:glycosyltransferase family A protein [Flavobacterium soyangense]MBF2708229.1 glycosyltransferase family 2 protein [Flavobacterium soyangense]